MSIKVLTYNVLSHKLANTFNFPYTREEYLNDTNRLSLILDQLCEYIDNEYIICLQEVSLTWSGILDIFFEKSKYTTSYISYHKIESDYMGVYTAIPTNKFYRECIVYSCPIDFLPSRKYSWFKKYFPCYEATEEIEKRVKSNNNKLIAIKLNIHDFKFWIINYHMPSDFKYEETMILHTKLIKLAIQKITRNDPYILCGDFNIQPNSIMYSILCSNIDEKNNSIPLKSAYFEFNKKEPNYTSYCHRVNEKFKGTLDYIFYYGMDLLFVPKLKLNNVLMPNENNPSDHLPISAEFYIENDINLDEEPTTTEEEFSF
jgi:mRNA deadenylase 3'-5' endonuclease subunit Ccr4